MIEAPITSFQISEKKVFYPFLNRNIISNYFDFLFGRFHHILRLFFLVDYIYLIIFIVYSTNKSS